MKENEYRCNRCGNVYKKGWSDEEADKESLELHGATRHNSDMVIICNDCFEEFRSNGVF